MQKLLHTFAALADLGQEIADTGDFQEMVRTSLHLLLGSLAIMRGAVTEYDSEARVLRFIASRGFGEDVPEYLTLDSETINELMANGLCAISLEKDEASGQKLFLRHRQFLAAHRIQLLLPLVVRGRLIGLIFLGDKASGEVFTAEDREVLCAMGRHIGVGIQERRLLEELEHRAIENRNLYEDLRAIYQDTVRAFAAAIDCKDKYTQGHSERVGKYSEIIAREMGWSDEEVEGIAVAGYLHDIGKLVVERDILNAPYRIDAKQSSELNRHPAAGYEILSPIHHPYADISLMARYHHERLDGRGYPEGLTGDQIPLGAKIVALADSFDAMTTDRPYKRRRSLEEVVEDFRRNTGKQFAPEVVTAFCRALLKEVNGEAGERRIIRLLGKGYVEPERISPLLLELIEELESGAFTSAASQA
ncbi:MAG: HD domain-containing protein [Acidobacteria bacterium]|nr:HD domain-containing protein [Acidobacteriota bacterium]